LNCEKVTKDVAEAILSYTKLSITPALELFDNQNYFCKREIDEHSTVQWFSSHDIQIYHEDANKEKGLGLKTRNLQIAGQEVIEIKYGWFKN